MTATIEKHKTFADIAPVFGATVTWANLVDLIGEASTVHVCFFAHDGKEYVGRAMEIPKDAALKRARWGAEQHADDGEKVNVSTAGGCLFFGGN